MLFLVSAVIFVVGAYFDEFAEFYSVTVSSFIRCGLSYITGFTNFSIAEIVLFALVPAMAAIIVLIIVYLFVKLSAALRILCYLLGSSLLLGSLFINSFGICYFRKSLEENMNLQRKHLTREELYNCSLDIKTELEQKLDKIDFGNDYASVNPHTWNEMSELIDRGYDKLISEYDFISNINAVSKKIIFSPYMTYTHISGIYMPLTGEANINTNYPDYVVTFTMAHEKAHQRGIAGEDEANFIAFLALSVSDDVYLQYSAYMSMYDYYLDAMYEHDREMYSYMIEQSDRRVLGEMYAYSVFFDKYRNSPASKVSDTVNDTYIKVMGDDEGTKSYGNVVELVYAYKSKKSLR